MKHKHYDLIIAWADGATIQYLGWNVEAAEMNRLFDKNLETRVWLDCDGGPNWYTDFEYRIKPEPKPDVIRFVRAINGDEKIKLIFEGETGVLKSAEVIK
jgi:hypothetical protein